MVLTCNQEFIEPSESESGEEAYAVTDSTQVSTLEKVAWIPWFCSLPGKEYLVEVDESFLKDEFNFTGLDSTAPYYLEALEMIFNIKPKRRYSEADTSLIKASAEKLYGLIHQRYILTRQGMNEMASKYDRGDFGYCPRYLCNGTPVVPTGQSDFMGVEPVKLYCPNCLDIYTPPNQNLDGAFFGTTFAHLFLVTYSPNIYTHFRNTTYKPRIYGFKVSEFSEVGPRNQWLRTRYNQNDELNESTSDCDVSSDSEEGQHLHLQNSPSKERQIDKKSGNPTSCSLS